MDIVLEIADTFVGDHLYAWLMPARPAPYDLAHDDFTNGTTGTFSAWQYKPATHLIYLEPSEAAYMSAWPRDNIYRQAISLYTITL